MYVDQIILRKMKLFFPGPLPCWLWQTLLPADGEFGLAAPVWPQSIIYPAAGWDLPRLNTASRGHWSGEDKTSVSRPLWDWLGAWRFRARTDCLAPAHRHCLLRQGDAFGSCWVTLSHRGCQVGGPGRVHRDCPLLALSAPQVCPPWGILGKRE